MWRMCSKARSFADEPRSRPFDPAIYLPHGALTIACPDYGWGFPLSMILFRKPVPTFRDHAHNPMSKKLPTAGKVRRAVPASQIHNETSVESSLAPIERS